MRPGPLIRRLFGPYERGVAEAYRRIFVDLDELAQLMAAWVPQARKILEVGCGEGAMTERIVRTYPTATVTAIDISPKAGRLYRGQTSTVTFSQETVQDVACREPASFDLVVLSDVIHHVAADARRPLICAVDQAMAPNGSLLFKEWVVSGSPVHWLVYMSCRYLTGDDVAYCTIGSMKALVTEIFGRGTIRRIGTVRPWHNNVAVLVRRSEQPFSGDTANR
jgi:2-polyprenyl-6-hydroxyphenyl methylase/3-demethylubiquinone-9 3-methyltransferase